MGSGVGVGGCADTLSAVNITRMKRLTNPIRNIFEYMSLPPGKELSTSLLSPKCLTLFLTQLLIP
jgi:hypothetical protein